MLLGFASYFQLGQDEDPPFTFRAMVVRAFWPGATRAAGGRAGDRQAREDAAGGAYADIIRSYSKPGESLIILQLKDCVAAQGGVQRLVPRCARRSATCATRCRAA